MRPLLKWLFAVVFLPTLAAAQAPSSDVANQFVEAAIERTTHKVIYDGSYRRLAYPGGDVPDHIGVCTDLVIRAYRAVGVDLQRLVHEEMTAHFELYPRIWGLSGPDSNIDQRRVPNLQTFLRRAGAQLTPSSTATDYYPGDVVTWMLPGNLPHIGIVVNRTSLNGRRPLVAHNIGGGPEIRDVLFEYPITGHFRYTGPR